MRDETPQILGHAGLTGRQQIVRIPDGDEVVEIYDEEGNLVPPAPVEPVVQRAAPGVMPPNCLRVLQSPRAQTCHDSGGQGFGPCDGLQDDGGCLLDIVRQARERGVEPEFEVRWDEHGNQSWRYVGHPLA